MEPDSISIFSQDISIFLILSRFNPTHTDISYLYNIYFNIIRQYKSCKMSVSVKFSIRILYVFFKCDTESISFYLFLVMQMMTLFIHPLVTSSRYLSLFRQYPISVHP